ncbi:MAG: hypothetical protein L6243_02170 [Candidatus Altiarchaeales archaeon]|nr:hypothetical protein [Candidatus Altiarchaeota archaeon]MBU4342026.1 hypothetical protein [Candidatus Altiarchaeota archaeon]MCG2782375.1 hypothetical protein [Candidatus Altiarchaeales archaeon]
MDAKTELEGNYLRHHPSEKELDRYEQEYLECCLIPEIEGRHYKKLGAMERHNHFSGALAQTF